MPTLTKRNLKGYINIRLSRLQSTKNKMEKKKKKKRLINKMINGSIQHEDATFLNVNVLISTVSKYIKQKLTEEIRNCVFQLLLMISIPFSQ